jgi:hypothetical protein
MASMPVAVSAGRLAGDIRIGAHSCEAHAGSPTLGCALSTCVGARTRASAARPSSTAHTQAGRDHRCDTRPGGSPHQSGLTRPSDRALSDPSSHGSPHGTRPMGGTTANGRTRSPGPAGRHARRTAAGDQIVHARARGPCDRSLAPGASRRSRRTRTRRPPRPPAFAGPPTQPITIRPSTPRLSPDPPIERLGAVKVRTRASVAVDRACLGR